MRNSKVIAVVLSVSLTLSGFASAVSAAVVGTGEAFTMEQTGTRLLAVQAKLAREDVQQAMIALGVDPAQAAQRVAALDEQELASLDGQLSNLPAGGSLLALIGAVFVVLLILELTGVIDIFKKT